MPMGRFEWIGRRFLCVGGHHCGEWKYLNPDDCEQTLFCTVCEKQKFRVHHD